jgi:hypothetical protein
LNEHRSNEEAMLNHIYNRIKKDDVVIDVGVTIGNYTLFLVEFRGQESSWPSDEIRDLNYSG